jgi:hypothetical protein
MHMDITEEQIHEKWDKKTLENPQNEIIYYNEIIFVLQKIHFLNLYWH